MNFFVFLFFSSFSSGSYFDFPLGVLIWEVKGISDLHCQEHSLVYTDEEVKEIQTFFFL